MHKTFHVLKIEAFSKEGDQAMIRFRYIYLIFCITLVLMLSACDRDEITVGAVVEGIQVIGTGSVFSEPDIAVLNCF